MAELTFPAFIKKGLKTVINFFFGIRALTPHCNSEEHRAIAKRQQVGQVTCMSSLKSSHVSQHLCCQPCSYTRSTSHGNREAVTTRLLGQCTTKLKQQAEDNRRQKGTPPNMHALRVSPKRVRLPCVHFRPLGICAVQMS